MSIETLAPEPAVQNFDNASHFTDLEGTQFVADAEGIFAAADSLS